ncbi:TPA: HAD family hydrolase [Proteus mirabilis]|uniref:HAD family hydrolase n=1 Tax=Proteus mirabilis TaxID=584 RepID=UPI0013D4BA50|nr:HAD family hydrolase [Proteus mirabilis]MBG2846755.1 HAD family hydrolase [Proteus mirabilis]MBG3121732.1 HAD family hydrolase [Proteus mirabilis]MBI6231296.1 HAD family hydrolase [Proteus mirabilis]MBI6292789.1 HAD family hydrolase [Proteus mirabilis]MBI6326007.1 HAD family hydrolase [Proteus mirabilis]
MQPQFENAKNTVKTLSVFDFDGTLTYHDSFIPFLKFAFGRRKFARRIIKMVFPTLRCFRRKLTRDELKEVLIKTFLTDIKEEWLKEKAEAFCQAYWTKLMRPAGLLAVAEEINRHAEVTICSASPAMVLQPFADRLGIKLIGTTLEVVDGLLTGKIIGNNCRCGEKIKRLERVYGDLTQYHLRAWGDSRGDHELLYAAQDPHWRYFHTGSNKSKKSPIKITLKKDS